MDLLDGLHERLIAALATAGPDGAKDLLTIGDIYQRLIPYRGVRNELGVMELAAYEHALLRLLAGEGQYVEIEDSRTLDEIRRELASLNPILGVYRDYSETTVRVLTRVSGSGRGADSAPVARPERARPSTAPGIDDATAPVAAAKASPPPQSPSPPPQPAVAGAPSRPLSPAVCGACGKSLPALTGIRFCPYCGGLPAQPTCARCDAELQPDWNFCIRCGSSATMRAEG